jgi:hypothetical protein
MESLFSSGWRSVVLPILLTALVVGTAVGFAFSA